MPRKPSQEERAKKYMSLLNVSYNEALQMVIDDDTIDNGGKCDWEVELTPEQKKIVRKARMADREVKMEKTKRTRKADENKQEIIDYLTRALDDIDGENIEVLNPEREIAFSRGGRQFKITLSSPRVPKE